MDKVYQREPISRDDDLSALSQTGEVAELSLRDVVVGAIHVRRPENGHREAP